MKKESVQSEKKYYINDREVSDTIFKSKLRGCLTTTVKYENGKEYFKFDTLQYNELLSGLFKGWTYTYCTHTRSGLVRLVFKIKTPKIYAWLDEEKQNCEKGKQRVLEHIKSKKSKVTADV